MASAVRIRRHVTSEILAVSTKITDHSFVTIPRGSTIETRDDLTEPGLHEVIFKGVVLLAFVRDIRERTYADEI